eukprot:TRINITY_DN553_c0_g3_i1.p1 TRINITY_DN553_c0_g3~~TRINITY_DN553_c0_g3_i1.p1  ORF type:complete len:530 (-),score=91.99 TRINITY_DN553_c0_g3_i1:16-1521(-)
MSSLFFHHIVCATILLSLLFSLQEVQGTAVSGRIRAVRTSDGVTLGYVTRLNSVYYRLQTNINSAMRFSFDASLPRFSLETSPTSSGYVANRPYWGPGCSNSADFRVDQDSSCYIRPIVYTTPSSPAAFSDFKFVQSSIWALGTDNQLTLEWINTNGQPFGTNIIHINDATFLQLTGDWAARQAEAARVGTNVKQILLYWEQDAADVITASATTAAAYAVTTSAFDSATTSALNSATTTSALHSTTSAAHATTTGAFDSATTTGAFDLATTTSALNSATTTAAAAGTGHVSQDPHFVGLQGERYDVMGEPEKWFSIVSDTDFMINAFYHQNSYYLKGRTIMQQVAIAAGSHRILANLTEVYLYNNKDDAEIIISIGATILLPFNANNKSVSSSSSSSSASIFEIHRVSKVEWEIRTPSYLIVLYHQRLHQEPYWDIDVSLIDKTRTPHGLLGQTAHHAHQDGDHHSTKGKQGKGEIEGSYKDYEVDGPYSTDFIFNKFVEI